MAIGMALFVVAVLIIAIWLVIELKRFKHKIFAIFLICLVLFSYLSFVTVFKDKDIDFKSIDGMITGGKIYLSWMGSTFSNIKSVTSNVIKMDWGADDNISEEEE